MDGERGPLPVTVHIRFWCLLALFQLASSVFAGPTSHRQQGFDALGKGDCRAAVAHLLQARGEGDSSNPVMLRLSQALECDGRMVDALSATYAGNESDTAGRVELLLFRANLLRKIGMEDEARVVEREVGERLATDLVEVRSNGFPESAVWDWSVSLSVGGLHQGDAKKMADSLKIVGDFVRVGERGSDSSWAVDGSLQGWSDSMSITGAQIPVGLSLGVQVFRDPWIAFLQLPVQLAMDPDGSGWISGTAGLSLFGSWKWSPRLSTDASFAVDRTWYRMDEGDPIHQTEFVASLSGACDFGSWSLSEANSFKSSYDASDRRVGSNGSHSLSASVPLPKRFSVSFSGAYSWYLGTVATTWDSTGLPAMWIHVDGAELGMSNKSPDLRFLDAEGNVLSFNDLQLKRAWSGAAPGQFVETTGSFAYPLSSRSDCWGATGSIGLAQRPVPSVSWSVVFDVGRTEWFADQIGAYLSEEAIWNQLLENSKDELEPLYFYRDRSSGVDHWIPSPLGSNIGPVAFRRRRVDWATTLRLRARWTVFPRVSVAGGCSWTRNRSSMEHLLDGSSYTRTVWNASTSVSW